MLTLPVLSVCDSYRVTLKKETSSPEEHSELIHACHKRCAERTLRVLEKNGSIFIKLGQHLSSMGYLLPLEWTTTFTPLQDKCPVSSIESIGEMFVADTGHTVDELFSSFDSEPIGAASLAQVHIGTLKDSGQKVAVKVQHPALAEWVPLDLALTRFTFAMLKRFFPEYDLEWLSREMDYSLPVELDFRCEAENATRASQYFKEHSKAPLVIPGGTFLFLSSLLSKQTIRDLVLIWGVGKQSNGPKSAFWSWNSSQAAVQMTSTS